MAKINKKLGLIILGAILLLSAVLRLWKLDKVPVSLFGDELDVGYQAYSIIKTGKDYSGNPWPLHFQSLAERRTPIFIYSTIPTVAIFGINPWGVRLPAAIFGILGIWGIYLLTLELTQNKKASLVAAFVLAVSPWHIEYSRAAFEVTELLAFLLFGLYFFFKAQKNGKYLWIATALLVLTPLIYSTAKLFTPFLLLFLFLTYRRDIFQLSKKYILYAVAAGLICGIPTAYSTLFGGGTLRFDYISVFTDPTLEGEVGYARLTDAQVEGVGRSLVSKVSSRLIHNKFTFWGDKIVVNYFEAFSTNFLFIKGDLNLRHSIQGVGEFYKVEAIAILLGLSSFFIFFKNRRAKALVAFWILFGVIPSAITRDGGMHATRLILILPPLVILIAYGLVEGTKLFGKRLRKYFLLIYILLYTGGFFFYQHNYWVHNPWYSERWWHAGFKEMVQSVKELQGKYDKIIISNAGEPPKIFFAAWYQFPPDRWQKDFTKENVEGFGDLEKIDKFYFGQVSNIGIYGLPKVMDNKTLYVAVEKEIGFNLTMEPGRIPAGLHLVKTILYPSGEPAFYLFEKAK